MFYPKNTSFRCLNVIKWLSYSFIITLFISVYAYSESSDADAAAAQGIDADSLIVIMDPDVSPLMARSSRGSKAKSFERALKGTLTLKPMPRRASQQAQERRVRAEQAVRNLNNMYRVDPEEGVTLEELKASLKSMPGVLHVEPNYRVYPFAMPNDPYAGAKDAADEALGKKNHVWGLHNYGQSYYTQQGVLTTGTTDADIDWLEVWESGNMPTDEVVVAVIDTGVDYNHPELVNQMWINADEIPGNGIDDDNNGYIDDIYGIDTLNGDSDPMDDHAHGTHCAGTIAAEGNNNQGIIGVNPYAKIMALKFLGSQGGSTLDAITCIEYAVNNGAKILSNSWGGGPYMQTLQDMIVYANEQGCVFVAAAGNSNTIKDSYPAAYYGVLAVAATDSDDVKASFSNYGNWVDIAAPGVNILSLKWTGYDKSFYVHPEESSLLVQSGTSMACPAVAGAASLLYAKTPGKDPFLYMEALKHSTDDIYSVPGNETFGPAGSPRRFYLGKGRLNLNNALSYDAPIAFMETWMDTGAGFKPEGVIPGAPGEINVEIGTWSQPMTGLEVRLVNASAYMEITGASSYAVGTVDAFQKIKIPANTFTVKVSDSAPMGTLTYIDVQLHNASGMIASKRLYISVFSADITRYIIKDLDGDGFKEVIGESSRGSDTVIYCYDHNGALIWRTVVDVGDFEVVYDIFADDFDGDGMPEIVISSNKFGGTGKLYQLEHDGTYTGVLADTVFTRQIDSGAVADLNNDGKSDFVFSLGSGSLSYTLMAMSGDGTVLWTYASRGSNFKISSPAIADLDRDGTMEIVVTEGSGHTNSDPNYAPAQVHIFDFSGNKLRTFTLDEHTRYRAQPIVADFDADGDYDILVYGNYGIDSSSPYRHEIIDAFTGKPLPGWPRALGVDRTDLAVGDMDGDGDLELAALGTGTDTYENVIKAFHHDGAMLENFPVQDEQMMQVKSILLSDVNGDRKADIVYLSNYQKNNTNNTESFEIRALDHTGMLLHDYPITLTQDLAPVHTSARMSISPMQPGFDAGSIGSANIIVTYDMGVHLYDTGYEYDPYTAFWPSFAQNFNYTSTAPYLARNLEARFLSSVYNGYQSVSVEFYTDVFGADQNGLSYAWDFDNNGTTDATVKNPTHVFNTPGTYTVSLTVSNAAGESYTWTRENLIEVYAGTTPVAGFTVDRTIADAPVTLFFTDTSTEGADVWEWDFDNDGTIDSYEQNPSWLYTTQGKKTVKLTVRNSKHGVSNTITKTNYIDLGNFGTVTTLYVSPNGSHSAPFKTIEEAANDIQSAIDAADPGATIIVLPGTYTYRGPEIQVAKINKEGISLIGQKGPDLTIIDGENGKRCLAINGDNITVSGFKIRRGGYVMGGGISFVGKNGNISDMIIEDCNSPSDVLFGGAPALSVGGIYSELLFTDSIVRNNASYSGYAVISSNGTSDLVIDRCIIANNLGNDATQDASALNWATVRNSLIYGNTGGVYVIRAFSVENCTIVNNHSTRGAVLLDTSKSGYTEPVAFARNNIIWNNTSDMGNPDFSLYEYNTSTKTFSSVDYSYQYFIYENNICSMLPTGIDGSNFIADPLFINAGANDYRINTTSPAFNAGTAANADITNWQDLESKSRVIGSAPDIGAYEYDSVTNNLPPVVNFTLTTTPTYYIGDTLTFDASASYDADGTITNYAWQWDDGSPVENTASPSITHSYSAAGAYKVILTITDNTGATDTTYFAFVVEDAGSVPPSGLTITSGTNMPVSLSWTDNATDETAYIVQRKASSINPIEVIVDDTDPGFFARGYEYIDWMTTTNPSAYNGSFHYPDNFNVSIKFSRHFEAHFSPSVPEDGLYNVYIWYPDNNSFPVENPYVNEDWTTWSPSMYFKLQTSIETFTGSINATQNSGQWNKVGMYEMDGNTTFVLSQAQSIGFIVADAVRFEKVDPFETVATLGADSITYTDTSVSDGRTYTYRVIAIRNGVESAPSNEASVTIDFINTNPTITLDTASPTSGVQPVFVTATATATDVEDDDATLDYRWNFGDGFTGSIQKGVNMTTASYSYRYSGTYTISVKAIDSEGFESNVATTTINILSAIPSAPSDLSAVQFNGSRIDLSWTDNAFNESSLQLQRKVGAGNFSTLATLGASVTSYSDTNIEPNTEYSYRILASNSEGNSDWSNTVTLTTMDLRAPTGVTVTVIDSANLQIDWTDVATAETSYVLERRTGQIEIIVDNLDGAQTSSTGSWTSSTNVPGYYGEDYVHDGNLGNGSASFRFTPQIDYSGTYEVFTWHSSNASRASNVPFVISHDGGIANHTVDQKSNSGMWVSLGSYALSNGAYLEMSNTSTNGYVSADAARFVMGSTPSSWSHVTALNANETSYIDTGLTESTIYEYRIRAVNNTFVGPYSANASAITPALPIGAPLRPNTLAGAPDANTPKVDLTWSDNANDETGYEVWRIVNGVLPGSVLDNDAGSGVAITGAWTPATGLANYHGSNYLSDAGLAKGTASVTYSPNITGSRALSLWTVKHPLGADRVPVSITHTGGADTVYISQSNLATPLLEWDFRGAADGLTLTDISNTGTQSATWATGLTGATTTSSALRIRTPVSQSVYAGNNSLGYNSGTIVIEVDFSGWNVVGTANDQWFQINLTSDLATTVSLGLVLQQNADGLAFWARALGDGTDVGSVTAPIKQYGDTVNDEVTLRLVADYDANTYEVFYRDNSTNGAFVSGGSGVIDPVRDGKSLRIRMTSDWSGAGEYLDLSRIRILDGLASTPDAGAWLDLGTYTLDGASSVVVGTEDTFALVTADALNAIPADAANWQQIGTLAADSTSYTDSTVVNGATYDYRVRSEKTGIYSSWSNQITVSVPEVGSISTYSDWQAGIAWEVGDDSTEIGDPDGDGVSNFMEYALRSNPLAHDVSSNLIVAKENASGTDYLSLTFNRNRDAQDVRYVVETSTDLNAWSTAFDFTAGTDVVDSVNVSILSQDAGKQTVKVRVPFTGEKLFYRIYLTNH